MLQVSIHIHTWKLIHCGFVCSTGYFYNFHGKEKNLTILFGISKLAILSTFNFLVHVPAYAVSGREERKYGSVS